MDIVILLLFLASNLFSNDYTKTGLYIKEFQENSQLSEIFSDSKSSKFYLMEFNGNFIPDPSTSSGNLNFKMILKNLYEFCKNPPKNDFARLSIIEEKDGNLILHKFQLRPWDGFIKFEEKVKNFQNVENLEKQYHNSFKYLQNAKKYIEERNFERAKRYLKLIKIIDPSSREAEESDILKVKIEFEEVLAEAEINERQKNYDSALKYYEELKDIYKQNLDIFKERENFEKEVNSKIEEIKNQMAEIEKQRKEEERLKAERERQEKERIEALKIEKERMEKEKKLKEQREREEKIKLAEKEKEEKIKLAEKEKEEKISNLLNKFRIFRQNKEYDKAIDTMNELSEIARDNQKVKEEIAKFEKEMFEENLNKSKESLRKKDYISSLKYLYSANSWIKGNEDVSTLKAELQEKIKFGQIKEGYLAVFLWEPDNDLSFILAPPANEKKYIGKIFLWSGILKDKYSDLYIVEMGNNSFCFEADFDIDVSFNRYVQVIGGYIGNKEFIYNNGAPAPCLLAMWVGD